MEGRSKVEPVDTLAVVIEAAVALAGFAGIVATIGREGWNASDSLQLRNLLSTAFSALFLSVFALVLLHAGVPASTTWTTLSVAWLVVGALETLVNLRALPKQRGTEEPQVFRAVSVFWFVTAVAGLVLQVYNVAVARAFWPILVGIAWLFGLSCFSFWRLLVRRQAE